MLRPFASLTATCWQSLLPWPERADCHVKHREALVLLQHRLDKMWTLCDAASFLLMQQRAIVEALTTDFHFEQAGFTRLLYP
jgi:predicted nucleic acid-binding protein